MRITTTTLVASLIAILTSQPCLAQFENSAAPPAVAKSAAAETPAAVNDVFTDQGNGTFKHNESGLVWLSNPTTIPAPRNLEEATAWVANLKSGEHGLTDGSQPGDWRLATAAEWDTAQTEGHRSLYPIFFVGWPEKNEAGQPEMYSRGYIGTATAGDRWDGQYNLTTWGNGGRDSLQFGRGGYIWPVRSSSANDGNNMSSTKDLYVYEPGRLVVVLDQPLQEDSAGYIAYGKSVSLNDPRLGVTLSLSINTTENYYSFELVTPGVEGLDGGGIGNRTGIFGYCDDWNLHRGTQTIYASGVGMQAALQDLQVKLNGVDGRIAVTGTGDGARADAVISFEFK